MANLLVDERDHRFVLFEMLKVQELCKTEKYKEHSEQLFDILLETAYKMGQNDIWPTYQEGDKLGGAQMIDGKVILPECFRAPYEKFKRDGWLTLDMPFEFEGQQMPHSVSLAAMEVFTAANPAFTFLAYCGPVAGKLIQNFGTDRQRKLYMEPLYSGIWGGTMCLTEPDAGSDVGSLTTTAIPMDDGRYKIRGSKIFITNGDHNMNENIVHPVLARIEGDPAGTKGISIFIVPKNAVNEDGSMGDSNDVQTVSVEHKLGIKSSPTCQLNFGDDDNCIGELLGEKQAGLKIMFQMMNEARIAVGLQGVAQGSASYLHALKYAKERIQGVSMEKFKDPKARKVEIINHPDVRRMLLGMKSTVEGMRALLYYAAYCLDKTATTEEKESKRWAERLELLTPIVKAYCSDNGFRVCETGIQILGGYGYCQEFPMEQFLRDAKIGSIYEGTNGIQSIDLLARKLGLKGGQVLMAFLAEIGELASKHMEGTLSEEAKILDKTREIFAEIAMHLMMAFQSGKLAHTLLNATAVLDLMGDLTLGWLLLWQAGLAEEKLVEIAPNLTGKDLADACENSEDVAFYTGKIAAAKFFINRVLTMAPGKAEVIKNQDTAALTIPETAF